MKVAVLMPGTKVTIRQEDGAEMVFTLPRQSSIAELKVCSTIARLTIDYLARVCCYP